MKLNKIFFNTTSLVNSDWLVFFRISIASFAILQILSIWNDIPNILLENAYVKPEIFDAIIDRYSATIFDLHTYLTSLQLNIEYDTLVYVVIGTYLFSLVCLLMGLFTRFSAIVSFLLQVMIIKSMQLYLYGADFFLSMALFYCIIFPMKEFSIDRLLFKNRKINPVSARWSLILLQAHLCIIYCISGFDKGLGISWYNGESIWKAVSSHNYNGLLSLPDYNLPSYVYVVAGILTLIVEFFYPIFINLRKTRKLWLYLTVGMHLSIIVFMGLYFFGTIMIILNLAAYYCPYYSKEKEKITSDEVTFI